MRADRRRPWVLLLVAAVLAVATSGGVFAARAGATLVVSKAVGDPDVIVSLASHEWERLPEAARQAYRSPRALVVLTRPERPTVFNCHDCDNRVSRLAHLGVETARVRVLQLTQGGTYGEALATRRLLDESGFRRVLVVTSPYHTRRSLATFTRVLGGRCLVGVQGATATSPAQPSRWWAAPYDRAYVRYEWAAVLYYALRYGVVASGA